jgi:hypothetical protein
VPRLQFRLATLGLLIVIIGMASALVIEDRRMRVLATRIRDLEKELATRRRGGAGDAVARHWKATLAKNQAIIEAAKKRKASNEAAVTGPTVDQQALAWDVARDQFQAQQAAETAKRKQACESKSSNPEQRGRPGGP